MNSRRLLAGAVVLAGLAVLASVAWRAFDEDTSADPTIVALTEFAAAPTTTFPAIEDSAVRDPSTRTAPVTGAFEIVAVVDHDPDAFTQGLEFAGDRLFESTGLIGRSTLRETDPTTGEVIRSRDVPGVFAEGLTIVDDEILQLTWTEEIAYRYDRDTFELLDTYAYEGQGWGLCHDGTRLVMSNGSTRLTFRDVETFAELGSVEVTFNGAPVPRLNELECVDGAVWANVWLTPLIIEIDPATGRVLRVVDATSLLPESVDGNAQAVLNGIAHDAATDTFLLSGKLWPLSYRVRITSP